MKTKDEMAYHISDSKLNDCFLITIIEKSIMAFSDAFRITIVLLSQRRPVEDNKNILIYIYIYILLFCYFIWLAGIRYNIILQKR